MRLSREQIVANRDALTAALKDGGIALTGFSLGVPEGWISFEGMSPSGEKATFDLGHSAAGFYAGLGNEPRSLDQISYRVGDEDFETHALAWAVSGLLDGESEDGVSNGRRRILAMFSPDGEASHAEAVAFLDAAFETVRQAVAAGLESRRAAA